jgi:CRP/FNR family transcriptional regulator
LPGDLRSTFEALKTSVSYRRGEVAFHETEPCHSVFIVCDGRVKLVTGSTEGRVLLLRFARPGEILGLAEAVLGPVPYEYSAIAVEPTVFAVIASQTFVRFLSSYAETCVRLTVALSEQYKEAQRETRFLAFGETSTARLARLLLDWSAERGQKTAEGVRIPSRVTHTDIAQSIGATRETVTRILSTLSHRGIVERTQDEILIRRANELARLGTY